MLSNPLFPVFAMFLFFIVGPAIPLAWRGIMAITPEVWAVYACSSVTVFLIEMSILVFHLALGDATYTATEAGFWHSAAYLLPFTSGTLTHVMLTAYMQQRQERKATVRGIEGG